MPEPLKDTVKAEVHHMLERDIIRSSSSSSPLLSPVSFCVDYCKLNSDTHHDAYALPKIDATLDSLAGCKFFTTLDLASGFWQVALEETHKEKTAFSTP